MAAFALGNGISRAHIPIDLLMTLGPVYACNAVYRTHTPTVLVATDRPIATEIQAAGYARHNRFYTRRPEPHTGAQPVPRPYFGFSSGPIAVALAAQDGAELIYMLGFDLGPDAQGRFNNVFADTQHYKKLGSQPTFTGNWVRQIITVMRDHPKTQFVRVQGATTAIITDLDQCQNLTAMPMNQFESLINKPKDLG